VGVFGEVAEVLVAVVVVVVVVEVGWCEVVVGSALVADVAEVSASFASPQPAAISRRATVMSAAR
jgi:hypothetical protein